MVVHFEECCDYEQLNHTIFLQNECINEQRLLERVGAKMNIADALKFTQMRMKFFKGRKMLLEESFGSVPNTMYFDGDLDRIRAHYEFRKTQELDEFLIDDTTWHDLTMDEIFKRINPRLTTSGEQYLYYLLRCPVLSEDEYERRHELIKFMEENRKARLKLQIILSKLGRRRDVKLHEKFISADVKYGKVILYIILAILVVVWPILGFLVFRESQVLPFMIVAQVAFNIIFHTWITSGIEYELQTVNYILRMIATARKIKKLNLADLAIYFKNFGASVDKLKTLNRIAFSIEDGKGEVMKDEITMLFMYVLNKGFFIDLIAFELVKNKLGKYHDAIFDIHETIGALDASIAVASYRKSLSEFSEPVIHFDKDADISLKITDMAHPLVKNSVLNSVDTSTSILLTGSNASGKSTFLRAVTLNMIMAQSICTTLTKHYEAPAFYIYSSMAIADNLLAGDSYFIAEIKSMKRIVDIAKIKRPIFCVIDEILRGTNTVERVSASTELLKYLAKQNTLCFGATHDIELCQLLEQDYQMLHFTETITEDGQVVFDYLIRMGPTRTRNAIKLLGALGFDQALVDAANARASCYGESGS